MAQSLCIIGGGPAATGLLWTLAQDPQVRGQYDVTIVHDQASLGGHCSTYWVTNPNTNAQIPVDIGVQCISPLANPNVSAVLQSGEFPSLAPLEPVTSLTASCAFPAMNNNQMNWGNFPDYQNPNDSEQRFQLWNEAGMAADCAQLQTYIAASPATGRMAYTVEAALNDPAFPFTYENLQDFINYFVDPFMNVINGYGKPDLSQILVGDLLPIFGRIPGFDGPLASWSVPGEGWQRFKNGASTWVQGMYDIALGLGQPVTLQSTTATKVWLANGLTGPVTVATEADTTGTTYDKVVLAVDMWTCANLLSCDENQSYWTSLYSNALDKSLWDLLQTGKCYIHSDKSILAPDLLPLSEEVAQFNAVNAPLDAYPYYDIDLAYTTYLVENVRNGDATAEGLYVTMYGPDLGTKTPAPASILAEEDFTHGMWLPSYMIDAKRQMHTVQGAGTLTGVTNAGTNLYFTGNNLTFDSVEGALVSGMAIANYAFGASYPVPPSVLTTVAFGMFCYLYLDVMFPIADESTKTLARQRLAADALKPT
jgi:hypothetical protein